MNKLLYAGIACLVFLLGCNSSKKTTSLVPKQPSQAPDYFCTWNLQCYVASHSSKEAERKAMVEENIFGKGIYQHWDSMYKKVHGDLYFLLDDSWDVPVTDDKNYYGSLIVDSSRFPSVSGMKPAERLKSLSSRLRSDGWKGLGLWICAQEASKYETPDSIEYWKERLQWMDAADVGYWKVDWGERAASPQWRSFLTALGKTNAPRLHIEHAMTPSVLSSIEIYRTYDVENVIAIPYTIARIGELLSYLPQGKAISIINCEDEPYIAAGAGCSIGVMRHEFNGRLPNGVQDIAFPPVGRDLKNRLDEIVRGIRWHRIALPFNINATDVYIDTTQLHDYWVMGKNESWMNRKVGEVNSMSAPAIITRGIEKPVVTLKKGDTIQPYILASKYPNGSIAVAAIGRTINREYINPRADVLLKVEDLSKPFGIFGCFNKLTIQLAKPSTFRQIFAQDLVGDQPVDVTHKILVKGDKVVISGELIDQIGLMCATKGDKSEPGLVLSFHK